MHERHWILTLRWFAVAWTVMAVAAMVVSNMMIINKVPSILGVPPFNVRDNWLVALLLAPGAIAAIAEIVIRRRDKARAPPRWR